MTRTDARVARDLRKLMAVLSAYQEELVSFERDTPAVAPLREAVEAAIAEAGDCLLARVPMRGAGIH
jgi:hypothetical protein